jgi:hypothetical protein
MSNLPFRIGLAGLSRVDARRLLPALAGLDQRHVALAAVADAEAGSAQAELGLLDTAAGRRAAFTAGHAVATDFTPDAITIHEDAEVMVAEDDLDAVVVAAVDRPAEIAEQALRRGLDVLLLAPAALADPAALLSLPDLVGRFGPVFWPVHPAGLIRSSAAAVVAPELMGSVIGARATWNLVRSPRPEPAEAARFLHLTAPLAALLEARAVERTEVSVIGRGVERAVHVGWDTASGRSAEVEVRLGWALGRHDRASITLHGSGGAHVDLPLVEPDATTEPDTRVLRGVLWHPVQGPLTLPPPRTLAAGYRALLTDWVDACRDRRPERAPVATASAAARMAADLAAALRQDG